MSPTTITRPRSPALTVARGLMPAAQGRSFTVRTVNANGYTQDIIEAILTLFKRSWRDTAALAQRLKGPTDEATLRNVWAFARHQITYILDTPEGTQYIKTPRAVIATGFCDCKGLATLQNSLLVNLGFRPYYKFVSFVPGGAPTHVFTQVDANGKTYQLDACLYSFNIEKSPAGVQLYPALTS